MIDFQKAYERLKERYGLEFVEFDILDVSEAFKESECRTLRDAEVYLGKLPKGLGLLTAMARDYRNMNPTDFASEHVSRHLSDMNEEIGIGRYTIFGTELRTDRRVYRDYVVPCLVSDALCMHAKDFFVISDKRKIDGISGLKGITLYEMRYACEIASADLRDGDLIVISTYQQAIKNIERNMKERLLT